MNPQAIRFVVLCEGASDRPLVAHLRRLLSSCGASETVGSAIPLSTIPDHRYHRGSPLARKIQTALTAESEFDLLFVHRDANSAGYAARSGEISQAMGSVGRSIDWIPIIPGRATEAWLLLDEDAIRRAAGNPRGRQPLHLPRPAQVEGVSDPKTALRDALAEASGHTGNRLGRFKQRFGSQRRVLLEQLPPGGGLAQVASWLRLRQAVTDFVARVNTRTL